MSQHLGLRQRWQAIRSNISGNVISEFAFTMPIMLTLMIGGVEVSNYASVKTQISQLALQVADNASRIGEGNPLAALKIEERNINDVLTGAGLQAAKLNIYANYNEVVGGTTTVKGKGRIVITQLLPTANPNVANTYRIAWQRCMGLGTYARQYGKVGQPSGVGMVGMGPTGRQVTVPDANALIFVEVHYRYEPLFNIGWQRDIFGTRMDYQDINAVASMIVRDDRDTREVYNTGAATQASCGSV